MTIARGLEITGQVVASTGKPVLLMTYTNPVLHYGIERFARAAADSGAAGLIIADLPIEEADPFLVAARNAGLGMALFAAPTTTDERLGAIAAAEPSFVYAVASLGVTGERAEGSDVGQRLCHADPFDLRRSDRCRGRYLDSRTSGRSSGDGRRRHCGQRPGENGPGSRHPRGSRKRSQRRSSRPPQSRSPGSVAAARRADRETRCCEVRVRIADHAARCATGTGRGTRTPTGFRPADFESAASSIPPSRRCTPWYRPTSRKRYRPSSAVEATRPQCLSFADGTTRRANLPPERRDQSSSGRGTSRPRS